jgi:hypothetical protein
MKLLSLFALILLLFGCSDSSPDSKVAKHMPAPELEGILVTSSAPVAIAKLQEQSVYLYFLPIDCETCWKTLVQAEKLREQTLVVGVVTSTDNFAVYEKARSHFLNLLPVYADHDENIAYDYDVEQSPLWVTIENGLITSRSRTAPTAVGLAQ